MVKRGPRRQRAHVHARRHTLDLQWHGGGRFNGSSDPALFEKVPVYWDPKGRDAFLATYTGLCALRHQHSALTDGSVIWLLELRAEQHRHLPSPKQHRGDPLSGKHFKSPSIGAHQPGARGEFKVLFGSKDGKTEVGRALPCADLGAYEWQIYQRPIKP